MLCKELDVTDLQVCSATDRSEEVVSRQGVLDAERSSREASVSNPWCHGGGRLHTSWREETITSLCLAWHQPLVWRSLLAVYWGERWAVLCNTFHNVCWSCILSSFSWCLSFLRILALKSHCKGPVTPLSFRNLVIDGERMRMMFPRC